MQELNNRRPGEDDIRFIYDPQDLGELPTVPRRAVRANANLVPPPFWEQDTVKLPTGFDYREHLDMYTPPEDFKIATFTFSQIYKEYIKYDLKLTNKEAYAQPRSKSETILGQLLTRYHESFDEVKDDTVKKSTIVQSTSTRKENIWREHHTDGEILRKMAWELDPERMSAATSSPFLHVAMEGNKVIGCIWGFRINAHYSSLLQVGERKTGPLSFYKKMNRLSDILNEYASGPKREATYVSEAFVAPDKSKNGKVIAHLIHEVMSHEVRDDIRFIFGKTLDLSEGVIGQRPPMAGILEAFYCKAVLKLGTWLPNKMLDLEYALYVGDWRKVQDVFTTYPPNKIGRFFIKRAREIKQEQEARRQVH